MGGPLPSIKLNLTRVVVVETGMGTGTGTTTEIGDVTVIVIGAEIVTVVAVGVDPVETVSNVESPVILLVSAPLEKGQEVEEVVDMVEGMTSMEEAAAMDPIVTVIDILDEAETQVAMVDRGTINIVVIDLDRMSVPRQVASVHDRYAAFSLRVPLWCGTHAVLIDPILTKKFQRSCFIFANHRKKHSSGISSCDESIGSYDEKY